MSDEQPSPPDAERRRLDEQRHGMRNWRLWGPYLAERQWGTVREDYSEHGDAWNYIPHEHARSRAYRWGEDGIAGISDDGQALCLSLGLWNGADRILKERMFGLTGPQGNHGEDVKELYWYLDALPSHAYLRMLYKYPQAAFPYERLVEENRKRSRLDTEFELIDTGIFDGDRYFDVSIEYAKADEADILMRVTATNRGPEPAALHLLPQMVFANHWSWTEGHPKPSMRGEGAVVVAEHRRLGRYTLHHETAQAVLFCENETNPAILGMPPVEGAVYKDGIHCRVVEGEAEAVRAYGPATKCALWHEAVIAPGESWTIRVRLMRGDPIIPPFAGFDALIDSRRAEADRFYGLLQTDIPDADACLVQRQALSGMIWNKQFYNIDIYRWLRGDPSLPEPPQNRRRGRNADWRHLYACDIISMPDKWEYPWFAAWDLAFHCVTFALVDTDFAKQQLLLLATETFMHPNGQMPAYEWNFSDANPPVHAWAAWRVYQIERELHGTEDRVFLETVFHKLLLNFAWWVNRKDAQGHNVFQGGFLGLDNIGVFDRSRPLPMGGHIDQTDGTAWMAMFALSMLRIAIELAFNDHAFEDIASKFFEHFLYIAQALNDARDGGVGLWSETDKFFHDLLRLPDGRVQELRLRSMVGLTPLFAVETIEPETMRRLPRFAARMRSFLARRPDLANYVAHWNEPGVGERRLLSLVRGHKLKRLLHRMLDPAEFLSDYGIRSLSRVHAAHPYVYESDGARVSVGYEPGESHTDMFGGNSNWRGPVWLPMNYLIVESVISFHHYYGSDFLVEYPTGSRRFRTLREVALDLATRLTRLFLRGPDGRRPALGAHDKLQTDPHFGGLVLFHEYFHGDSGAGLGAEHQTGWTALVANLIIMRAAPLTTNTVSEAPALSDEPSSRPREPVVPLGPIRSGRAPIA